MAMVRRSFFATMLNTILVVKVAPRSDEVSVYGAVYWHCLAPPPSLHGARWATVQQSSVLV